MITISIFIAIVVVFLLIGTPFKPLRFVGQAVIKLLVGALFLFLLNTIGVYFGLRVPINAVTTVIAGFLGIPGVAALTIIKYVVLI
ncbi:pro-sigmaK processing inhibitor BofA family protein [Camelliibacillus cellulosilyticus]|uniref:Pro-sigmaK processing inhibitor BofA family protein n=1 Tax=Camelliibacillus cellulosilyticus TaxID=2174486 RepID=A0ABV9GP08_9BACL